METENPKEPNGQCHLISIKDEPKELCHVNKNGDCGEEADDEIVHSHETETNPQIANEGKADKIVSDSPGIGMIRDDPKWSNVRTQVWDQLVENGFASMATESNIDQILEMMMNGTLESPDQLCSVLGIDPSTETIENDADLEEMSPENEYDDSFDIKIERDESMDQSTDRKLSAWEIAGNCNMASEQISSGNPETMLKGCSSQPKSIHENCNLTHNSEKSFKDESGERERLYNCTTCGKPYRSKSGLRRHTKTHKMPSNYCVTCAKSFQTLSALLSHKRSHQHKQVIERKYQKQGSSESEKSYACVTCKKLFDSKTQFISHRRANSCERPFKCGFCEKSYRHRENLMAHTRTHMRSTNCTGNVPPKSVTGDKSSSKIKSPLKSVTGDKSSSKIKSPLKSVTGDKSSKIKSPLKSVTGDKSSSKIKSPLKSVTGDKSSSKIKSPLKSVTGDKSSSKIKSHCTEDTKTRTTEIPYACVICYEWFNCEASLEQHVATHPTDGQYPCVTCNKPFSRKHDFLRHRKSIKCILSRNIPKKKLVSIIPPSNEKLYTCITCHKSFKRNSYLKLHLATHIGDQPYKCATCGKSFRHRSSVLRHVRAHVNNKNDNWDEIIVNDGEHKCVTCGKVFEQRSNLLKHYLIHTSIRSHKCVTCGKLFFSKYQLLQHKITHSRIVSEHVKSHGEYNTNKT